MPPPPSAEITRLLRAWSGGDQAALTRLTAVIYPELHGLARNYMRRENPGITLQTTALVNEAYLRLSQTDAIPWQDRVHFFAVSAQIMRRILVDAAKGRTRGKRGGAAVRFSLDESLDGVPARAEELIALDEALEALGRFDERKDRVVEMRFFGGLSVNETAKALSISPQSVMRDWKLAKAWLMRALGS